MERDIAPEPGQLDRCGWRSIHRAHSRWIVLVAIAAGIVIGRAVPDISLTIAATPDAAATATRSAELDELERLRTSVAEPIVCSPEPTATSTNTPTPEPTATIVPAAMAGTEVIDASGWSITVLSIQPVPVPEGVTVTGQLMQINLKLTNPRDTAESPPFFDWRLVDEAGNRYSVDVMVTSAIAPYYWGLKVDAHTTEERTIVFDVAADAGTTFVIEHEKDPTFRIEVEVESRA